MFKKRKTTGNTRSKKHDLYVKEDAVTPEPLKVPKPQVQVESHSSEDEWELAVLQRNISNQKVQKEFPTYESVIEKLQAKLRSLEAQ